MRVMVLFVTVIWFLGCSNEAAIQKESTVARDSHGAPTFTVTGVEYGAEHNLWTAHAVFRNTTRESYAIAGYVEPSRLPSISAVGVEWEKLEEGRWHDVTPLRDGIGIEYMLAPGEEVRFDASVFGDRIATGDVLRLKYCGTISEQFVVPVPPENPVGNEMKPGDGPAK